MALGTRTFFALLPVGVKELLKAYYHHANEAWVQDHRVAENKARDKASMCRVRVVRYNRGEPQEVSYSSLRSGRMGSDYIWIDSKSPPPPITIQYKWNDTSLVPWVELLTDNERTIAHNNLRAAQYDLVAAKLAVTIAAWECGYPDLFTNVCWYLLGVSTARGHVAV